MNAPDIPPGFKLLRPPLTHFQTINRITWSPDGHTIAAPSDGQSIRLWNTQTVQEPRVLIGHTGIVYSTSWSPGGSMLATGASDGTIRIWDTRTGQTLRVLRGHANEIYCVAWSADNSLIASGSADGTVRLWDVHTGQQSAILLEYSETINYVAWMPGKLILAACSANRTIIWDVSKKERLVTLIQSVPSNIATTASQIYALAWSPDGNLLATGSADCTIRLWNPYDGREIRILEGHTGVITSLSFSSDSYFLVSKSRDKSVRLWRTDTWRQVSTFSEATLVNKHAGVAFHPSKLMLATLGNDDKIIRLWGLDEKILLDAQLDTTSIYYTNAKIALVGDSGVGKSSLGMVLARHPFVPTESTHGRKVWLFDNQEVQLSNGHKEIHETLVWDLAGQPGYRLIHQLHLSDVSVALVVFDSRSETDPFAGIHHWVNALRVAQRAQGSSAPPMKRFLVAARVDRRGKSVSAPRIQELVQEMGFDDDFEVSARENLNIDLLMKAIEDAIEWDKLPKVTSTELFQHIKDFLMLEQKAGRFLSSVDDLYRAFAQYIGALHQPKDLREQFATCIGLVEAKGLIRRFSFGDLVLLQPEWLDAYASALVNSARDEPDGLGCISEEKVRAGDFSIPQGERLRDKSQEALLLIAMVEDLLRFEIVLREEGELIFPFQSTRENLDLPKLEERQKVVIFRFDGPVMNIYATLAVRLSHSGLFIKKDLWKNAITYTTKVGGTYGLFLNNTGQGSAELVLFFDDMVREETSFHFEEFVSTHLRRKAIPETIQQRRVFVCFTCKTPVTDLQVVRRRERGFDWISCSVCDTRIDLRAWAERSGSSPSSRVLQMNNTADERRDQGTAQSRLQGKIAVRDFDVFLCHNMRDKSTVKKMGERLKERGILPWLDEWELRPGLPWQRLLEQQIESIRSAAVFVGQDSMGPWQRAELEAFLRQFVNRGCPVIPVVLPDVPEDMELKLPAFLENMTWIDFRKSEPDPMKQLIWGVTGDRDS